MKDEGSNRHIFILYSLSFFIFIFQFQPHTSYLRVLRVLCG
jgi:hypothetical protein